MTLTNVHTDFDLVILQFEEPGCIVNMQITYAKFADLTADIPGDLHEKARVYVSHMQQIGDLMI